MIVESKRCTQMRQNNKLKLKANILNKTAENILN
jgi:hypothetical protein